MKVFCGFVFLALATASIAAGQKPAPKPAQPAKVENTQDPNRITLDVFRVNLLYTVSDRRNRFVTNLKADDFDVFEGKKQQRILEFVSETDLPLRLAILIDTSNSIRERFRFEQEAATEFINNLIRPRQDKALVVSFDTNMELVADLMDDTEKLAASVRNLRPGGGTSLYDAVFYACRDKLLQDQPRHKFRRAMVILSDGDDNQSRYTRDQALEMAQKADVVIYTISINITKIESDGDKVLRYLSSETGGQTFFPFKVQDLSQSFENISNELRHQYSLLYRPEPLRSDGLWQPIQIRVKNRKDLLVRARKGYFAPRL
jgi:VWFA-related protein